VAVFRRTEDTRIAVRSEIDRVRKDWAQDPTIMAADVVVANSSALESVWGEALKALPVASFTLLFF
jgi:hypothetical protein